MPAPNPTRELFSREALRHGPYGAFRERYELFDPFAQIVQTIGVFEPLTINQAAMQALAVANPNWELLGTNASNALQVLSVDGGFAMLTNTADNDQAIICPRSAINSIHSSSWARTTFEPQHESRFQLIFELSSVADIIVQMGLSAYTLGTGPALDVGTEADQAKFQFSTEGAVSTTTWTAIESIDGTDTETELDIDAAAAAETINLEIRFSSTSIPRFYVNGVKVHTGASAHDVDATLHPFVGVQALTTGSKGIVLRQARASRVWQDS